MRLSFYGYQNGASVWGQAVVYLFICTGGVQLHEASQPQLNNHHVQSRNVSIRHTKANISTGNHGKSASVGMMHGGAQLESLNQNENCYKK